MDVKCERCNTEYEFDDALVSGRGTTVKCTNCGHKFKIRRSDGDFSEDFWNITTVDGRTLVFTSLRELQRAIQGYLVERNDRLSRGGLPPKAIGQIPELAPFFEQRDLAKSLRQGDFASKTQDGLGPGIPPIAVSSVPPGPMRPRQVTRPEFPAPPPGGTPGAPDVQPGKATLIGTGPAVDEPAIPRSIVTVPPPPGVASKSSPPPALRPREAAAGGSAPASASPAPRGAAPPRPRSLRPGLSSGNEPPSSRPGEADARALTSDAAAAARESKASAPASPPPAPNPAVVTAGPAPAGTLLPQVPTPAETVPVSLGGLAEAAERDEASGSEPRTDFGAASPPSVHISSPIPPRPLASLPPTTEEELAELRESSASFPDGLTPKRRSVGGYVVMMVVVGCLVTLGAVWAQNNLGELLGSKRAAPVASVDPRVVEFLATGEKALADGNLDLAKESLDKASALADREPRVLLGLARLAAVRADLLWLKERLLPPEASDDHRVTRDDLIELAVAARKAADEALRVAPDDPEALRATIDAFRISGDRDGARALVGKISPSMASPETAYVLAALDLAEAEPLWSTVVERLKVASGAETGPGRARAALVYALVRSGDVPGAKAEVERLDGMTRAHPLLPLLRAFTTRKKSSLVTVAAVDGGSPVAGDPSKGKPGGRPAGAGGMPTDPRELIALGERARARGDYDRARVYFSSALEKNPNDSEALAGIAAIAYAQRDLEGARSSFKRVLATNPNYMPAVIGLADVEWDSGNKTLAGKMYSDILERYPGGSYPTRVRLRAAEGGGGG